jgi:archaeal flagellar protein FlaI
MAAGLPFVLERSESEHEHGEQCSLHAFLPPDLRRACDESPELSDYLHCLPFSEVGIPQYYAKLSRDLQKLKERNLIYPIDEGLFVHVYPDELGARDYYVSIEPNLTVDLGNLLVEIEQRLIEYADQVGVAADDEEKRRLLLEVLDEICTTDRYEESDRVYVTPRQYSAIQYLMVRDKVGMGLLHPLLCDPYIEDISCSGIGPVFIEHKIFSSLQSSLLFETHEEVDDFVVLLGEWIKRPVTVRNPIVDAVLPDGSRINIVYGREITTRGSNFTIRKFSDTPLSVLDLIDFGTLDYRMAAYLSLVLEEGLNMFVAGATASGKTTLLNALTTFFRPDSKVVTIEDTPEVQVPHKNWLREVTRAASREQRASDVNMFDLLKAALRQRPDRIIVGEIRGEEGLIAFQAMQTGHGVMATFHAASVEKLIQRLTGDPINVPKTYMDNLHVVAIQAAVRGPDGRMVRRVLSISEIIGYDSVSETFSIIEVFRWNSATDTFDFPGDMNSYILEEMIAMRKGLPNQRRREIYTELRKRARIFERIHKQKGVKDFDGFFRIFSEAHRQGLF